MDDPFDELLNLEEQYYEEGYQQGYIDGQKQSRLEARLFGIEKGFEKFVVMGKLQAKACIWAARLHGSTLFDDCGHQPVVAETGADLLQLRPLQDNHRLEKHVTKLLALVDPTSLSTENTDDAVAEFDDRLKRAQAKEKIIERLIGESGTDSNRTAKQEGNSGTEMVDMENFGSK